MKLSNFLKLFLILTLVLSFSFACTQKKSDKIEPEVLARFQVDLNPGSGEVLITPVTNASELEPDRKIASPLFNLGWENSITLSSGYNRVEPENCAPADYNATAKILTATLKLINATEPGYVPEIRGMEMPSPCDVGGYCDETFMAPVELRWWTLEVKGICDTTCDPLCESAACIDTTTPPVLVQADITGINKDSGCDPIEDNDGNDFLDCMFDDPNFSYTAPDYDEYELHPTWDYTSKCDVDTDDPAQALDPGEHSGCKFLQFNFTHAGLDANHIPLIGGQVDILGYVQGSGLDLPVVDAVTTPTNVITQDIGVTIDTGAGANSVTITGGAAEVTCEDNDPCDSDATVGYLVITITLNANQLNNLYVYQFDTVPPTNQSAGKFTPITHDNVVISVNSADPLPNEINVSPSTNIQVNFSEPADAASIDTNSILLYRGGTPIAGTVSLSPDGYTATLVPSGDLNGSSAHSITVCGAAGSEHPPCAAGNEVTDLAGNNLAADFTTDFTTGNADSIPPVVDSSNPPDNASGVALNTTVQITFSEPIDVASLSGNITVVDGATTISGDLTLSVDQETAIFTPNDAVNLSPADEFDASTEYTVTVTGGGGGIEDLATNVLQDTHIFSFTTGTVADTDPPDVVSTIPENNAINIAEYVTPEVTFDEAIDPDTINSSNLFLKKKSTEEIIPAILDLSADGITATLDPATTLENGVVYVITIGELITDLAGNSLLTPQTVEFTTAASADTIDPQVVATEPFYFESGVSLYVRPYIDFSEPMDPTTVSSATVYICEGRWSCDTVIDVDVELSETGLTAYIEQLNPPLRADLDHSIWVIGGAGGAKDLAGNTLSGGTLTNPFRTSVDPVDPSVLGMAPADGTTDISTNTNIVINFSEPVDPTTIIDANLYLHEFGSPTHIAGTLAVLPDDTWVRINPTASLDPSTVYVLEATTSITDYAGRNLAAFSGSFTTGTGVDPDGPTVTLTDPADNDTGVERWQDIIITFDESLDPATVDPSTVEIIRDYDSTKIPTAIKLSGDDTVITLDPFGLLNNDETFTVNLKTGIRNLAGFALQSFTTFDFATEDTSGDTTPPTIIFTDPVDNETGVDRDIIGTIIFSEPIDPDSANDGNISFEYCPGDCFVEPETVVIVDLVPGDTGYDAGTPANNINRKATITPYNRLLRRRWYRIYIEEFITDYAGNEMGADVVPYWRTGNN